MGYQKDRERFMQLFGRAFPTASHSDARALLRHATSTQRWNEAVCSFPMTEAQQARGEKKDERRTELVRAICARLGCKLDECGDPRGEAYTLIYGAQDFRLSVPGNGYPASAFR